MSRTEDAPVSSTNSTAPRYISLRWRLFLPTFALVLILAMVSAYGVARSLPSGAEMSRVNVLLNNGRLISERAAVIFERQRSEGERLAATPDLQMALNDRRTDLLQALLENFARRGDFDAALVTDAGGTDVYGLLRDSTGTYIPVTLAAASTQAIFSEVPVVAGDTILGRLYVGTRVSRWMDTVRGSAAAEVALYQSGRLLTTSVAESGALPVTPPAEYLAGAAAQQGEPFQALTLDDTLYLGVYTPLGNGDNVVAVFVPDNAPFAAEAGQQLIALTLATVAAGIIITVFVMSNYFLERINRVRVVAESLAAGEFAARTGMQPTDEIGALGRALDLYSEKTQQRYDKLRASLRRQRREVEYLNAVLDSLPDGAIIQDLDGSITFINERAKRLIGESYNFFKRAELREITAAVTDILGPALAPGLYTLGAPTRMEHEGRVLGLQAFAVMSLADRRVGTAIIVRDLTDTAQRERARAALFDRFVEDIGIAAESSAAFTREISPHAPALQKMIVEMRELLSGETPLVETSARLLPLETLVWAVANEWRQVAQAANLTVNVEVQRPGLTVYGDERRLRWALGNVVDNAIKYTPPGGRVSIEIKGEEDGFARLRIRDTGVGISADELPYVFTRFYRGNPVSTNGRELNVHGTGQGLTIARQIIEASGGRITLRSTPGVGTAVYLTLPRDEASASAFAPPTAGALERFADDEPVEDETFRLNENFHEF